MPDKQNSILQKKNVFSSLSCIIFFKATNDSVDSEIIQYMAKKNMNYTY